MMTCVLVAPCCSTGELEAHGTGACWLDDKWEFEMKIKGPGRVVRVCGNLIPGNKVVDDLMDMPQPVKRQKTSLFNRQSTLIDSVNDEADSQVPNDSQVVEDSQDVEDSQQFN